MAKVLKPLVIVLLLISIAALVMQAVVLYPKRTLVKERTQKLEAGISKIVGTLRQELPEEVFRSGGFQPQNFKVDNIENIGNIDREINKVDLFARSILTDLRNTRQDLETTRQDLENTKMELERVQAELDRANEEIATQKETIRKKDADLQAANRQITTLVDEKATLETQVDELNTELIQKNDDLLAMTEDRDLLETQLNICQQKDVESPEIPKGLTGKILYCNNDWNFVVLNIGSVQGLKPMAEMIIHRGDTMLGKIRITAVQNNVAVAEILNDWKKADVQEGDDVLN